LDIEYFNNTVLMILIVIHYFVTINIVIINSTMKIAIIIHNVFHLLNVLMENVEIWKNII
jgi:hypothetical protein